MALKAGDRIGSIFYASEEHRNENYLALSYEDKGEILVLENTIEFIGSISNFTLENILDIRQVESQSRELGDWVQIVHKDGNGDERTSNFIRLEDEVLMGKKKENNSEFFDELERFFGS